MVVQDLDIGSRGAEQLSRQGRCGSVPTVDDDVQTGERSALEGAQQHLAVLPERIVVAVYPAHSFRIASDLGAGQPRQHALDGRLSLIVELEPAAAENLQPVIVPGVV